MPKPRTNTTVRRYNLAMPIELDRAVTIAAVRAGMGKYEYVLSVLAQSVEKGSAK